MAMLDKHGVRHVVDPVFGGSRARTTACIPSDMGQNVKRTPDFYAMARETIEESLPSTSCPPPFSFPACFSTS